MGIHRSLTESTNIKAWLSIETYRFQNISSEFLTPIKMYPSLLWSPTSRKLLALACAPCRTYEQNSKSFNRTSISVTRNNPRFYFDGDEHFFGNNRAFEKYPSAIKTFQKKISFCVFHTLNEENNNVLASCEARGVIHL